MAPKAAAGSGGSTQDGAHKYKNAKDAKHLLDMIGKDVHEEVKKDAKKYIEALKGDLKEAKGIGETVGTADPCELQSEYNKLLALRGHPCENLSGKLEPRFSDTLGGQCTREKISGSTSTCGACAPYRRLHLCSHNLENISDYDSNARHKLLLEVCMAAKYEGASITRYHGEHQLTNKDSPSQLCTVLARSFADIGDIEAEKCKQKQDECKQQEEATRARGRSEDTSPQSPAGKEPEEEEEEEDDDEDDDDEEDTGPEEGSPPKEAVPDAVVDQEEGTVPPATDTSVDVCNTVKNALENRENLTKACEQKYQYGKEKFPNWKCISDSGVTTTGSEGRSPRVARSAPSGEKTTGGESTKSGATTGSSGAIC
ncbi:hypothetical protein PFTANZ_06473, partial [Plasmodium falciparum Tanzania (2000708)]